MPEPTPFDCERALAACARGDQAALRELYAAEGTRLLGVAQRIVRDRPLAEDIVHDTFVKVWQKAASFDPVRGEARGWLYSITRHLALNAVRDRQHEVTVDDGTAETLDAEAALQAWQDTQDSFDWRASTGRLGHCLERLDAVRRNCLLHAYVDGLSHSQIAERVGAPLGTVKAWIQRSLAALKVCMT
jgi:RNA polymerase sigma-70 factor (ECF subfamily)